jgi:hypothetical protein
MSFLIWRMGTWAVQTKPFFTYRRLYLCGHIWTPFVRATRRYFGPVEKG